MHRAALPYRDHGPRTMDRRIPLARAKRTDRNEARRRYRAQQAALTSDPEVEDEAPPEPTVRRRAAGSPATPQPVRPGITASFRAAFRPLDLRGDLAALPKIVTHWALLVSVAVSVIATAVFIGATNELGSSLDLSLSNPLAGKSIGSVSNVSYLVISLFVAPPPAAGAFLIGFTARRASWLGGLIQGIVAAGCYAAIVLSPAGRVLTGGGPTGGIIVSAAFISPLGAAMFAALAAWYRRFLNLANPNRNTRRPARQSGKQRSRSTTARSSGRR
jgi:hypothetical protein